MARAMSFFRYPGGKGKLADTITMALTELADGEMLEYREPFFGGGSVGLRYFVETPTLQRVWINDKDVGIACLWTAVINHHVELKSRVCEYVPDVADFDRFKDQLRAALPMPTGQNEIVDIGFKKLAIHQISYSGLRNHVWRTTRRRRASVQITRSTAAGPQTTFAIALTTCIRRSARSRSITVDARIWTSLI